MKILHFCTDDTIGAQGAAYDLNKALNLIGEDSRMFVKRKTRDDCSVYEYSLNWTQYDGCLELIDNIYFKENRYVGNPILSFIYPGCGFTQEEIRKFDVDIFHIHWVKNFLSVDDINMLQKLKKPIIVTLHDQYFFTSVCHYSLDCKKYEKDCSDCPQLVRNDMNITKDIFVIKKDCFAGKINIVATSQWMLDSAKKSEITKKCIIDKVPLGVDTDLFKLSDKDLAKQKFSIDKDTKVLLIGAQSLSQKIKGYSELYKSIEILAKDEDVNKLIQTKKILILAFGHNYQFIEKFSIPSVNLGYISDRNKMAEIFAASDVLLFPSLEEAFGLTALEAMASGVPVVAFDNCAMQEVIVEGQNGYKAVLGDADSFARKIKLALFDNRFKPTECRKKVMDKYTLENEARLMCEVYQKALNHSSDVKVKPVNDTELTRARKNVTGFIKNCMYEITTHKAPKLDSTIDYVAWGNENFGSDYLLRAAFTGVKNLINRKSLSNKDEIYLYGTGQLGIRYDKTLRYMDLPIAGYIDSDPAKWGTEFCGKKIINPEELKNPKFYNCKIIISCNANNKVSEILEEIGFIEGKTYFKCNIL